MNDEFEKRLCRTPSKPIANSLCGSPITPPVASPASSSSRYSGCKASPSPNKCHYGDRYIPSRAGARWSISFNCAQESAAAIYAARRAKDKEVNGDALAYTCILKNELVGARISSLHASGSHTVSAQPATPSTVSPSAGLAASARAGTDTCRSPCRDVPASADALTVLHYRSPKSLKYDCASHFSMSPISACSQNLLKHPRQTIRKISKTPYKVLDAPELQDDFYLNLVDWSTQNTVCVALNHCVYLWSASSAKVTRLCDLAPSHDTVTSVSANSTGNLIAIGTNKGHVQVWDVAKCQCVVNLAAHTARVGVLAWNSDLLCSGSRDRAVICRDVRAVSVSALAATQSSGHTRSATRSVSGERKLLAHQQEVCGLKWSPDNQMLASGGNDNKLFIWNLNSSSPVQTYSDHVAAVKAIAWSPHQHGLLASGGGTADKCIRFWNTLSAQPLQCRDTGSQVCNLGWSRHSQELVSTHGYSQHEIVVWKYPSLTQLTKLCGHTYRVLYLALSPDGESIVTGAGDETLRFWRVFSKDPETRVQKSALTLFSSIR